MHVCRFIIGTVLQIYSIFVKKKKENKNNTILNNDQNVNFHLPLQNIRFEIFDDNLTEKKYSYTHQNYNFDQL